MHILVLCNEVRTCIFMPRLRSPASNAVKVPTFEIKYNENIPCNNILNWDLVIVSITEITYCAVAEVWRGEVRRVNLFA